MPCAVACAVASSLPCAVASDSPASERLRRVLDYFTLRQVLDYFTLRQRQGQRDYDVHFAVCGTERVEKEEEKMVGGGWDWSAPKSQRGASRGQRVVSRRVASPSDPTRPTFGEGSLKGEQEET